jgi:hypothetical protein
MKIDKQIIKNSLEAQNKLQEHYENLKQLQNRGAEIASKFPELKEAVEEAETHKAKCLDDFALGKCDQDAVETAQHQHEEAVRTLNRTEELSQAINDKIHEFEAATHQLEEKARKTNTLIWNFISDRITNEVKIDIVDKVYYAFTANQRRNRPLRYETFLNNLFPKPNPEKMKSFGSRLDKMYQDVLR